MSQEQLKLNWHNYSDHLKEMMLNLMNSNETADATLVCEDKIKFKAHKFVLNACSPVFQSIINDLPLKDNSVIYLKGVLAKEMQSILQFMYLGEAIICHDRMKEFIDVAKSLEIKEISKDADCNDIESSESYVENDIEGIYLSEFIDDAKSPEIKETSKDTTCNVVDVEPSESTVKINNEGTYLSETDEKCINIKEEIRNTDTIKQSYVEDSGKKQCDQCDKLFLNKYTLARHVTSVHEGLNHQCNECDKSFNQKGNLVTHIKSVHEGVKFPCNLCPFKATQPANLCTHKKRKHSLMF